MQEIRNQLLEWISRASSSEAKKWLEEKKILLQQERDPKDLQIFFTMVPRKIPKVSLGISDEEKKKSQELRPDWFPENLDAQQAARIYLVLSLFTTSPEEFRRAIHELLSGADLNEQIALFAGLPVYPYPQELLSVAEEGTRSNATAVFDAIALENPYPRDFFPQEVFNRLVLKAAFMERPFLKIVGIPERSNPELASLLLDLVSERWAAGRAVNPMLWQLITPALDQDLYQEFKRKAEEQDHLARSAVALSFAESTAQKQALLGHQSWNSIQQEWENRKQP